jgi:hypothetical protein
VEDLAIGDLVLTADGRTVAVKWLGRQTIAAIFQPTGHGAVRIAAGALGEGLPTRDLRLTADHALLLDGVLVQAGALVNGTTIRHMSVAETGERYEVWHVETEGHEVIVAEACPAETFIDNATRARFDNYADFIALYGGAAPAMVEMEAPRIKSARQLPATLRARLAGKVSEAA